MLEFLKKKTTGHPEFHPQMVIFILETMAPQVEIKGVSAACANVSTLPVTVQTIASSVDAFDSRLRALEATTGLKVGGRVSLSRKSRIKLSRRNDTNGGNN